MKTVLTALFVVTSLVTTSIAQSVPPPDDIRNPEIRRDAIVGATVITRPGETLEEATLLLRDGLVEAIGVEIKVPAGYRVHDAEGLHVYPGFIDASVMTNAGEALARARGGAGAHWNERIVPQIRMRDAAGIDSGRRNALRDAGFTIAQIIPDTGILRGQGAVVLLADEDRHRRVVVDGMHAAAFETGGWGGGYPGSQMGAIALMRQTLAESEWHARAVGLHTQDPAALEMPEQADALDAMRSVLTREVPVMFTTNNELEALRAANIVREFEIDGVILGSGMEFRRLDEIVATSMPVIVPLEFPKKPAVTDPYAADRVTLRELQTWKHAPSNPARLLDAGADVSLTTNGLSNPSAFHAAVRTAIKAGLPADEALACITVRPARMLGIDSVAGTIAPGRLANLVVTDGELFDEGSEIREVWVGGRRDEVKAKKQFPLGGDFEVLVAGEVLEDLEASIDRDKNKLTIGPVKTDEDAEEDADESEENEPAADPEPNPDSMPERNDPVSGTWDCTIEVAEMGGLPVTMNFMLGEGDVVTGDMSSDMFAAELDGRFNRETSTLEIKMNMGQGPGTELELKIDGDRLEGSNEIMGGRTANMTGTKVAGIETGKKEADEPRAGRSPGRLRNIKLGGRGLGFAVDGAMFGLEGDVVGTAVVVEDRLIGSLQTLDGRFVPFELIPRMPEESTEEEATEDETSQEELVDATPDVEPLEALPVPLGVYGRLEPPRTRNVLIRDATIWTASDLGVIEDGDLLVIDGRIAAVGIDLVLPDGVTEIDGSGLHVTPGLIDCHSHTGISGGVNEGGQTNTAEVRIADVINPDDIDFYRQLAGGLTAANQLHGSANPIGGQNSVIKLRWGGTVEDMKFKGAKAGIKFALGENVKRGGGYPDTRMGVASFIEDALQAAVEYDAARDAFDALPPAEQARRMPPRPDFELDTVVEIIDGDRIIHCHSYRQDEILMLLRLCERYGIQIGTLQHILEGYKVADEIAAHGAGASSFSDWWAYKMEVMDAIPYNGALMHEVGVLVSFNSDDDELATRMNDEAAKAVRWGGLDPHEALKFVTINPARQLRIDERVGSLEPGKDADFVIWNAAPLSSYARCEQTWIDGARYYLRDEAAAYHADAMLERGRLLAKAGGGESDDESKNAGQDGTKPNDRSMKVPSEEVGGTPESQIKRIQLTPPDGRIRSGLIASMLEDRQNLLLERVARGEDPAAIRSGECGCGSGSMIELARSLARDRARLESLESEESR